MPSIILFLKKYVYIKMSNYLKIIFQCDLILQNKFLYFRGGGPFWEVWKKIKKKKYPPLRGEGGPFLEGTELISLQAFSSCPFLLLTLYVLLFLLSFDCWILAGVLESDSWDLLFIEGDSKFIIVLFIIESIIIWQIV